MSLNLKRLSFGDTIKFVVDGATVTNSGGSATTSSAVKPDGTTPADWKDFTTVEEGTITSKATDEDVFAPSPGAYRRVDVFRSMVAIDIKIIGQEVNELILQSVLQTATLANGSSAAVGGKLGQVRGWMQITRAAQNDATVLLAELYGILTCGVLKADGKRFKPEIDFAVLFNSHATITPTLASA